MPTAFTQSPYIRMPPLSLQSLPQRQRSSCLTFFFSIVLAANTPTGTRLSSNRVLHSYLQLRDKLRANLLLKHYQLQVDLRHLSLYNDELAHLIQNKPADILPLVRRVAFESGLHSTVFSQFENAATKASRAILFPFESGQNESPDASVHSIPKIQICVKSGLNMLQFRELTADTMNKLIRIPGIVISASVLSSRATKLHLQCRACRSIKVIYPAGGLGGLGGGAERGLPRVCDAPEPEGQKKDCPMDPYLIVHSKSTFSDHQTLKLQEAPDMVPVGELPRHIILSADRYNAAQVVPGSRVIATGIYSTFNSSKNVRSPPTSVVWVDQTRHRNPLVYLHYAHPIFALSILNCLRLLPQVQVV